MTIFVLQKNTEKGLYVAPKALGICFINGVGSGAGLLLIVERSHSLAAYLIFTSHALPSQKQTFSTGGSVLAARFNPKMSLSHLHGRLV